MFYRTPIILKWLFQELIWEVKSTEKVVYLTFDDGPHPEITPYVMDQLEKFGFRGTFFCIGDNVRKFKDTFTQIVERGHGIGNHTFHHVNGWKTGRDAYASEVQLCAELVPGVWFRPPYGRISRDQIKTLGGKFRIVMWSLLSWDFKPHLNTVKSLRKLKRHTHPGSIVVFHDSEKARKNLEILLPDYLSFLHSQGYRAELFK